MYSWQDLIDQEAKDALNDPISNWCIPYTNNYIFIKKCKFIYYAHTIIVKNGCDVKRHMYYHLQIIVAFF